MSNTSETPNTPDVWSRLWRTIGHLLGALLRVLFVIVIAVLLAAGVYFGAPWVYRQVIYPIQSSVAQLAILENQVDASSTQWAERFSAQQQRITDLESQVATQGERIASLEASLSRMGQASADQQAAWWSAQLGERHDVPLLHVPFGIPEEDPEPDIGSIDNVPAGPDLHS